MKKILLLTILSFALSNCKEENPLPPAKPELDTPANNSTGTELELTFKWKDSNGVLTYNFQLSTQSDFSSIDVNKPDLSALSVDITELKPNTNYFWQVNAENDAGISPWSATNNFTTKSLIVPTLIAPTDNSTQSINNLTFSWNTIAGVSGYNLQISTKDDFSSLVISKTNLNSASEEISDLMYGTNYFWRVSSIKSNSNSDWSVTRKFTTEPLGIPTLISPANGVIVTTNSIVFEWDAVTGANSYNIQVSDKVDFTTLALNKTNLTSTTFLSAGFKSNTAYYWRVNSMVENCQSEWSIAQSFATPAIPTAGLVAWYPFNGNANDESGNGNHGTISGGVTITSDRHNQNNKAYLFNGTSGYIEIPTLNNFQYKPITYSAWIIVNSYFPLSPGHKFRSIIGRQEQFNITCGLIGFYADQNVGGGAYDNAFLYWMGANGTPDAPYSKTKPTLNSWVHVVFTETINGDFAFYINGSLTNSGNIQDPQNANISFRIGSGIGANSFYWNDKIDDVRVYNRVLSSEEVMSLYNE